MDAGDVLTALREELIAAGLVRRPSEAGGAPPCHIEPVDGAPAPGEREAPENDAELVVTLIHDGDLSEPSGYDAALRRRAVINVRYRSANNAGLRAAMALDAAIISRLIRPATNYGYGFTIGTDAPIYVREANVFGGLGPIGRGRDRGFDHAARIMLEVAR